MSESSSNPREISYIRLFPWIRLGWAIRVAIDEKKLILAALGLMLVRLGGSALDSVFGESGRMVAPSIVPRTEIGGTAALGELIRLTAWRVTEPTRVMYAPFVEFFTPGGSVRSYGHAALEAIWVVAVWGLIGGAIARISILQLTGKPRINLGTAFLFALRRLGSLAGAPLCPMLAVALFAALCAGLGLVYRIPGGIGDIIGGVLAFVPLLAGLVMTLILLGLAAAWPLMVLTIAVEQEDIFDSFSRSYGYVSQRIGLYAVYAALSLVLGVVGLLIIEVIAALVVHLAVWGLSFGAPADRIALLFRAVTVSSAAPAALHEFWVRLVGLLAHGWIYSFFWSAATIVYQLLRHDVDGTPWDDVVVDPESPVPSTPDTQIDPQAKPWPETVSLPTATAPTAPAKSSGAWPETIEAPMPGSGEPPSPPSSE